MNEGSCYSYKEFNCIVMGEAAEEFPREKKSESKRKIPLLRDAVGSADEVVSSRFTSELVIAFCGPMGAPIESVVAAFRKEMTDTRDYQTSVIKISSLIRDLVGIDEESFGDEIVERKKKYIEAGDYMRTETKQPQILAAAAVSEIYKKKNELKRDAGDVARVCYLVDSLKHPAEIDLLKKVYADSFYLVGVYADRNARERIVSEGKASLLNKAQEIIDKDYDGGWDDDFTQKLGKVFHRSDFFVHTDGSDEEVVESKVRRFCNVVFGTKIVSPSVIERSMYSAWSAGANSACLSRQVGAAVVSSDDRLLGVGWNDVPRSGGGVYTDENLEKQGGRLVSLKDNRCYRYDTCACRNDTTKNEIITKLTNRIIGKFHGRLDLMDFEKIEKILRGSEISSLTEFSRAIHAEMHAMFNALKDHSSKLDGGSIFVTTYPCHNCARHIILSGIKMIHFIEPYPKSRAIELHDDALTDSIVEDGRVRLVAFEGIAPSRFLDLFSYSTEKRKNSSNYKFRETDPKTACPRSQINIESIEFLEANILDQYTRNIDEAGIGR